MKKLLKPFLISLTCLLISATGSFVISTKVSLAVYAEKFSESDRRFEDILKRLKSIDGKIDRVTMRSK
jgi:hypothetical protein